MLLLAAGLICLSASTAEARKLVLITHGDDITDLGPVVAEHTQLVTEITQATNVRVGYHYSHIGIFFVNLWTWGGTFCLHSDDTYWPVEPAEAAALSGSTSAELSKPFNYRFPPGWWVLGILGMVGIGKLMLDYNRTTPASELEPEPSDQTFDEMPQANESTKRRQHEYELPLPLATSEMSSSASDLQATRSDVRSAGSTSTRLVSKEEMEKTLRDPLYKKAIRLILENSSSLSTLSADPSKRPIELKPGLEYLMQHGIEKSEARPRLIAATRAVAKAYRKKRQGA